MKKLAIQKGDEEYLDYLFKLGEEKRDAFLEEIQKLGSFSHWSNYIDIFKSITGINTYKANEIIRFLFNIYNSFDLSNKEIYEFTLDIVRILNDHYGGTLKGADYESFREFFRKLLLLHDTFGIIAKIYRLTPQHQHLFVHCELYSDIRPVFRHGDPSSSPSAATIVHSLKIVYREGTETKDFYLGLTEDDLQELNETIERAIIKHGSLKEMISSLNIHCLKWEREE